MFDAVFMILKILKQIPKLKRHDALTSLDYMVAQPILIPTKNNTVSQVAPKIDSNGHRRIHSH